MVKRVQRYHTELKSDDEGEPRIVVARIEDARWTDLTMEFDTVLEQAIADDLHTNNGRMFGHDTLAFFTSFNTYPEKWACVEINDLRWRPSGAQIGSAIIERTPSHPHQSVVRYKYVPSKKFGGTRERAEFEISNWERE